MIAIEITSALLLYLGLFLLICFGAWGISHLKQRRKKPLPPLYELAICEYCQYGYLLRTGEKVSCCPQCQAYNKENVYSPKGS